MTFDLGFLFSKETSWQIFNVLYNEDCEIFSLHAYKIEQV